VVYVVDLVKDPLPMVRFYELDTGIFNKTHYIVLGLYDPRIFAAAALRRIHDHRPFF
jgi:hypothetical protein